MALRLGALLWRHGGRRGGGWPGHRHLAPAGRALALRCAHPAHQRVGWSVTLWLPGGRRLRLGSYRGRRQHPALARARMYSRAAPQLRFATLQLLAVAAVMARHALLHFKPTVAGRCPRGLIPSLLNHAQGVLFLSLSHSSLSSFNALCPCLSADCAEPKMCFSMWSMPLLRPASRVHFMPHYATTITRPASKGSGMWGSGAA